MHERRCSLANPVQALSVNLTLIFAFFFLFFLIFLFVQQAAGPVFLTILPLRLVHATFDLLLLFKLDFAMNTSLRPHSLIPNSLILISMHCYPTALVAASSLHV